MILPNYTTFRAWFATSATTGLDGLEVWPLASVRAGGFTGGISGVPRPITAFPLTLSCNDQAVDGGAAFDWYLSQRSDVAASQYLSLTQLSATQSGAVTLALTSAGATAIGAALVTSTINEDQLREALVHCTLYVQRRSDNAIQLVELLRYTLSDYG